MYLFQAKCDSWHLKTLMFFDLCCFMTSKYFLSKVKYMYRWQYFRWISQNKRKLGNRADSLHNRAFSYWAHVSCYWQIDSTRCNRPRRLWLFPNNLTTSARPTLLLWADHHTVEVNQQKKKTYIPLVQI